MLKSSRSKAGLRAWKRVRSKKERLDAAERYALIQKAEGEDQFGLFQAYCVADMEPVPNGVAREYAAHVTDLSPFLTREIGEEEDNAVVYIRQEREQTEGSIDALCSEVSGCQEKIESLNRDYNNQD